MIDNETWKEIKENSKSIYYVSNPENKQNANHKDGNKKFKLNENLLQ